MEGVGLSVYSGLCICVQEEVQIIWGLIRINDNQQLVVADTVNKALWFF